MDTGSFKMYIEASTTSAPTQKMSVVFDASFELKPFMIVSVALIYIAFFVIGVQAVVSKDYF